MLELLSEFCNLYVYSHGMRNYILEVLKVIDPEEKFFKDRDRTVLAPKDEEEQKKFSTNGKGIGDFKNETLAQSDWLIVDDQVGVIKERGN